ncbi:MAG: thiamine-phosphate kinase [Nitrospirae bacterium GWC2_46_6]|nr:MAG: thiamine-phosphate kinase [Nitrospirae bacterium GWA2_46_11]OGW22101.1 MAG: thiamine-phosphate kinase [Nitrospirae bacterium GWC2_46_6]OGW23271.1 MAG: thiamine-phosphate kinase [Nitrospirae bacterium GWB2_47_37]
MKLQKIGELKLLQEVRKRFKTEDSGIILGIGDDAAVLAPQKENILVTTDMMNEGIHFDLSFTPPFQLGFKLVSVNVSDITAMGGRPKYLFLNIALKNDADEKMFWDMYEGISKAMDMYGVKLVGGDLCSAKNDMVLSATVIGTAEKFISRAGAKAGDKIYVTGALGDSACGLEILKKLTPELKEKIGSSAEALIERHLMPVARDSSEIAKHATSMIDISDGLFIDLCRICDESNVGAKVYLDKIPISDEMENAAGIMGLDAMHLAVSGGEDYELLFTAPPTPPAPPLDKGGIGGVNITCIGEIIEKDRIAVDKTGKEFPMKAEGYRHFGAP